MGGGAQVLAIAGSRTLTVDGEACLI